MSEPTGWKRPDRFLRHVLDRRRAISANVPVWTEFELWEESCVPSYCHPNPAAAWVSWLRLFRAESLARSAGASGPVLDFGASIGELGQLIDPQRGYFFIEQDDAPARYLTKSLPHAVRTTLEDAPDAAFGCIFALDSLEHNEDYEAILARLVAKLAPGGLLVISGPTENWLYRVGRMLSGFRSHYHLTNIHQIEKSAARLLDLRRSATVPLGVPLFRISAWSERR